MRAAITDIVQAIRGFLSSSEERSIKFKKNIIHAILIKGGQVLVNLILIPLTISYVNPEQYGVWLTLSEIILWFTFLDIGISHGLRNKLVETEIKGQNLRTRIFVSTAYATLAIISLAMFVCFYFINSHLNWQSILNTTVLSPRELSQLTLLLFGFFCLQLTLQNINSILMSNHTPAKASLISFIGQSTILITIFFLSKVSTGDLKILVFVLGGVPPLALLVSSIWLFRNELSQYRPNFKLIQFRYAKNLLGLGGKFFLINIGVVVLYQSDNIIISQLFGPADVTIFNVAYKLFYSVILIFAIFMTPFWSAITDAYLKRDIQWIISMRQRFYKLIFTLTILTVVILIGSPLIYHWWIGDQVTVPSSLSILMSVYVVVYMWHNVQVNILNGIEKINLQLLLVIISAPLNIYLSILLTKPFGISGVVLSNTIVFLLMGIVLSIQCNRVLSFAMPANRGQIY